MSEITSLVDKTRTLSGLMTFLLASTPAEDFSSSTTDAIVSLAYQVTINLGELEALINPAEIN